MRPFFTACLVGLALLLAGWSDNRAGDSERRNSASEARGSAVSLPGGVRLIEKIGRAENDIVIPYEKYVLDNGLTVILHEDHSDPLVHVAVAYHVGSAREEIGKSGFAHFFEHMMFQGSENVADEEHLKMVTEAGGTFNGATSNDETKYYQTVPKNHLERVLWLEADRMGFLLPAVTQEKFEVQRATVKNERAQNIDNRPYGLVGERVVEALYPEGHPYSWLTIGYVEDLDRVDVDDLKAFFLRWYGPNNATLTVGGDFDKAQTLEWIVKYFGSIPRGPDVRKPEKLDVSLEADRYISMQDNVSLPLLHMTFPTIYMMHSDEAPLTALSSIIGAGATSLLYKSLVKTGLAVDAQADHACLEIACSFSVYALPNPASGTSLADLERIIRETFAEFETRGVEDDDLERLKGGLVSSMIFALESVSGKAGLLAFYETFFGDPDMTARDIASYENVTKADVIRVYDAYIKDKPAVIMSVVPHGQTQAVAAPDNWEKRPRALPDDAGVGEDALTLRAPVDNFDRSVKPGTGPRPVVKAPEIWRDETPKGVAVLGAVNDEAPITTIQFRIKTGQRDEPLDRLGLASLTAAMLNQATTQSSTEDLSDRLQKLGSQVSIGAGFDYTVVSIRTLTKNIDETLAIASEQLFQPKFQPEDFVRLKTQTMQAIQQGRNDPANIANGALQLLLFGDENTLAYPGGGTIETVAALTLDDVRGFYQDMVRASPAEIVVVSDLSSATLMSKLGEFASWNASRKTQTPIGALPNLNSGTLYFIDAPDAVQSEIRIARRTMNFDATGPYYRATLMNFPLGGNFNSRINQNIREDKGYAYGAQTGFSASEYAGEFVASASVRADATAASITEFINEMTAYAEHGMTEDELEYTRNALSQSGALAYETAGAKAGFLSALLTHDLDPGYTEERHQILKSITLEEIAALAETYLNTDDMIYLVVGDKETVRPQIEQLGMPVVEIDANARPIE